MWIYIQSILVYLTLLVLMVALSKTAIKNNKYGFVVAAIFLYALVLGLRYGVGMDYFGYLDIYESYVKFGSVRHEDMEIGFLGLVKITALFHSSVVYFALIAFLNLFFMTYALKGNLRLYPYLFFVFMLTGAWMAPANLARQCLAVSLWTFSVKFAVEKKLMFHYIFVLLAISFHYSAVFLVLFYPLLAYKQDWFRNIRIEVLMLVAALVVMNLNFVQDAIQRYDNILIFFGYDIYTSADYEDLLDRELVLGVGFFIKLFINVINILSSEKVKKWVNNPYYNAIYSLYFIGVLASYVFATSEMISRVNLYFISFTYIITSFTLYYSIVNRKKSLRLATMCLVALSFVAIMYKASTNWNLFVFKGQQEYYYLHRDHDKR